VLLLAAAIAAAAAPSCGGPGDGCLARAHARAAGDWVARVDEGDDGIRIETKGGEAFRVPRGPRRIVTTLPGLTEIVVMLGAAERLVGVPDLPDHGDPPPGTGDAVRLSVMPLAYETLTTLRPDLVLTDRVLLAGDLTEMRRRLPAVLPLESRSLGHLERSVTLLARVLDTEEARAKARAFGEEMRAAVDAARDAAKGRRVLLLAGAEPVYALGPGSLLDDMLAACGAVDVACDLGRASGPFAAELVRVRRPDWILVAAGAFPDALRVRWRDLPAVRDGRVARVDADRFVRAGPRTPGALRRLAAVLAGRDPASRLQGGP
jgi:vitamin B12 transport system substrate-binding protein